MILETGGSIRGLQNVHGEVKVRAMERKVRQENEPNAVPTAAKPTCCTIVVHRILQT